MRMVNYNRNRKEVQIDIEYILDAIGCGNAVEYFGAKLVLDNLDTNEVLDLIGSEKAKDHFQLKDDE